MFTKRLYTSYKFNLKLWNSVVDWTILAYILIPGIIIIGFLYRDFVLNLQPILIDPTILLIAFLIISFFVSKSTIRFFIYEADLLFFQQNVKKMINLKRTAVLYSFGCYNFLIILILGFATPFLFSIDLTFIDIMKIILVLNIFSMIHVSLNYLYKSSYVRLPILLVIHTFLILNFFSIHFGIYLILFIISAVILFRKIFSNRYWVTEVLWEYEGFYKWMKIIFQFSMEMSYYLPAKIRPPVFIFAKRRKLSDHRIDNLIYKSLLRKSSFFSLPLRLILLCIGLFIILPNWAKVVVLIITILGLFTSFDSILKEIKRASFFQLITPSEDEWISSKLRVQKRIIYPLIIALLLLFFIL